MGGSPKRIGTAPLDLERAGEALRAGRLAAFPTETVYGLGADAASPQAVAAVFEAKGRPAGNPLIVHTENLEAACRLAHFSPDALRLAEAFWPGPLTLVLPRRADAGLAEAVSAGAPTVAVRVPDHPAALGLLAASGCALAAPSANRSGRPSATRAEHVLEDLGDCPALSFVLDGGACRFGLESTIVMLEHGEAVLLRRGALDEARLREVVGVRGVRACQAGDAASPGRGFRHYAPSIPIRRNAVSAEADEAWLGFGLGAVPTEPRVVLNLSERGDASEAAANLFDALRCLERSGARGIAAAPVPNEGAGLALNERLMRAEAAWETADISEG